MVIGLSVNCLLLGFSMFTNIGKSSPSKITCVGIELNIWEFNTLLPKPDIPYQFLELYSMPYLYSQIMDTHTHNTFKKEFHQPSRVFFVFRLPVWL